eukprot:jgi/Tetstr1/457462/TSEL_044045.t1
MFVSGVLLMRGGVRHAAGPLLRRQVAACAAKSATTRVLVCSKNPVKVGAVQKAFGLAFPERAFEFRNTSAASGVPDQPFGDEETLAGARNRVANAAEQHEAALLVALEGGVGRDDRGELECFAWAVVFRRMKSGQGTGTVGRLTGGLITRQSYYEHTVLLALAPFLNPEHFPEHVWE